MARPTPKPPCDDALVWFTFVAHRRRWTVWIVPSEVLNRYFTEERPNRIIAGGCSWKRAWILLNASLPLRQLRIVCFHELIHACHGEPKKPSAVDEHETFVARLEKTLLKVTTKECALRFPPLPHEWRRMRRRLSKNAIQVVI